MLYSEKVIAHYLGDTSLSKLTKEQLENSVKVK